MAGFGTGGPRASVPRRTDARPLESFARLSIHALEAAGNIPYGATSLVVAIGDDKQIIRIDRLDGTLGGSYALWICECGERRRDLYLKGRWACRKCHRIDYTSRHDAWSPPMRRAMKLRARLGGELQPFGALPPRPKRWPQRRLYDRLLPRLLAAEAAALGALNVLTAAADARRKGNL
jgi:hypothetical protein